MALTTVSFDVNFDITTKEINITDTTNYAGAGVTLADAVGVLSLTDPTATEFYNNTDYNAPDITPNVSLVNSTDIDIPEPATDEFLLGIYSIIYTVKVDNGVDPVYYVSATKKVDFNYCSPEVSISQDVNCVSPLFTSTDVTTYTVNGISPTITRDHQLVFPAGSPLYLTPTVTTGATISVSVFYTGTQTSLITSTLSYDYGDGFTVTDVIQGTKEKLVDCSGVCEIYCGIKALYNRMINAKGVNLTKYNQYKAQLESCMTIVGLARVAMECDEQVDVDPYFDQIRLIGEFTDECLCPDSEVPTLVVGLVTTLQTIIVAAGNGMLVTSNTVENVTTYTVGNSYKYYKAVVVQSGTSIPTATTIHSDIGVMTYAYNGVGDFLVTSVESNALFSGKRVATLINGVLTGSVLQFASFGAYIDTLATEAQVFGNIQFRNVSNTPINDLPEATIEIIIY